MPEPNLIVGNEGNNNLTGTAGDDLIQGLAGNDTLSGVGGNDTLEGGEGTNTLSGGDGNDALVNNLGNADGGAGSDTLNVDYTGYERKVNNLNYSSGFYAPDLPGYLITYSNFEQFNLTGTAFNDTLRGLDNNDTLAGGLGNDSLNGYGGKDLVQGGAGNDTVNGGNLGDTLDGGEGSDYLADFSAAAETANITVNSTNNNNVTIGDTQITNFESLGNITTGSGSDTFTFADYTLGGNFNGNGGKDSFTSNYSGYGQAIKTTSSSLSNAANTNLLQYSNIEQFNLTATDFNDTINGLGNVDNILDGGKGTDYLTSFNATSQTADLTIDFTSSNNVEFGNTKITNFEAVGNITTGSGNDLFKLGAYTSKGTVNGGLGNDTLGVDYTGYERKVNNISYSGLYAPDLPGYLLTYSNFEQFNLTGTAFNDSLRGLDNNDTLTGGLGNDSLVGAGGKDNVQGGSGNDTVSGGNLGDTLDGGEGNDTLADFNASSETANVTLNSTSSSNVTVGDTQITNFEALGNIITGSGNDTFKFADYTLGGNFNGNGGKDSFTSNYSGYGQAIKNTSSSLSNAANTNLLQYSNIEQFNLTGTAFNDTLRGLDSDDSLAGGTGNDSLSGYGGQDLVQAGAGNDTVYGGTGEDNINGGVGNDSLLGEAGNDTINGSAGNDFIDGGIGNNSLMGGVGNDTFAGLNSGDIVDGGEGIDFLQTFNASNATVALKIDTNNLANLNYDNISIANIEFIGNVITGSGNDSFIYNSASSILGSSVNGNLGNDTLRVDFSSYQGAVGNTRTNSIFELNYDSTDLLSYSNIEQFKITGSNFNDSLRGGTGNDTIAGGLGNDSLLGQTGNDTIDGSIGNDTIDGGTGNDSLIGDSGNDTFVGVNSGDIIDGGEGYDLIQTLNASDATFDLNINSNNLSNLNYGNTSIVTFITNIEFINNITTGSGNDSFVFNRDDSVSGRSVNGSGGNDLLSVDYSSYQGAVGNTRTGSRFEVNNNGATLLAYSNIEQFNITGTNFNDSLLGGTGKDTIDSGSGDDILAVVNSSDIIDGGQGYDLIQTLNASDATIDLNINSDNLINLDYGNISFSNIEFINNITTGSGNDSFVFNRDDSVYGRSVNGSGGNDLLSVDYSGYQGAVGNTRTNSIFELNNNSTDLLAYSNIEQFNITGSNFNDSLLGGLGNDTIDSGSGNDYIYSWSGNDTLSGGDGNDTIDGATGDDFLLGGAGSDTLVGGIGNDTLSGGDGSDRFVYSGTTNSSFTTGAVGIDLLTDFTSGSDKIVLNKTTFTALTSIVGSGFSVASEFAVVASDSVAATADALIVYSSDTGNLFYNQNGVTADFGGGALFATLNGIPTLSADDFVLQQTYVFFD